MTVIKILLILAVIGLMVFVLRSHGTTRGGAYVKIGLGIFMAFAVYAVAGRPARSKPTVMAAVRLDRGTTVGRRPSPTRRVGLPPARCR